jgi:hypothetical protein
MGPPTTLEEVDLATEVGVNDGEGCRRQRHLHVDKPYVPPILANGWAP